MTQATITDTDFAHLFETLGAAGVAKRIGRDIRNVYYLRRNVEKRLGRRLVTPNQRNINPAQVLPAAPPAHRFTHAVWDGCVLIGSDAHYWPNIVTTAHRAFVHFIKRLKPEMVILNGDVLDGASISRHAPIGWEHRPSLIQEIETCQERLAEIEKAAKNAKLVWTLGNHDCLDPETECLTQRGWMRYDAISPEDKVLSLAGTEAVWSPIDQIVSGPFEGDLVRVEKTRLSMAVTPNHRVLLDRLDWRTGKYDLREYRPAGDLPWSFNLPVTGEVNAPGVPLSDDQIALAGWILTDGSMEPNGISIFQSEPEGRAEIERLLAALGLEYSAYVRQRGRRAVCGRALVNEPMESAQYRIKAESARRVWQWLPEKRRLPSWVIDASARQFQVLLDALIAGDGTWDGGDPAAKKCAVLYGAEEFLDSVQAAAVARGWRARVAKDSRGAFRLCLSKEQKLRVEAPQVFREHYEGGVWCLRVPHGNFMVRRNGAAYFTGNSRFETRLATVAPEFARVHGVHLKDHFPLWHPAWACWIGDQAVVKHRMRSGIHAPWNNTMNAGKTIVTGHLHSLKVVPLTDYNGTRWGVDCGTLADLDGPQFVDYLEASPTNWRSGFIVLTFRGGKLLDPEIVRVIGEGQVSFRGEVVDV